MNYGYIRVSTDMQTVENQRFTINNFAEAKGIVIDGWIEETTSGAKNYDKRKLGKLLKKIRKGDLIVCTEISRLGRSLFMVMEILNICMKKECKVWTVKDGYRLGDDIQSKVLAFAFGLASEIERTMICQRVKEALARKRAEGVVIGRPLGRKSKYVKLTGHEEEIQDLLDQKFPKLKIAEILGVNRMTVASFIKRNNLVVSRQHCKLAGHQQEIQALLDKKVSQREIATMFDVHPMTVHSFIQREYLVVSKKGRENELKLTGHKEEIQKLLNKGVSYIKIAKSLDVHYTTVSAFVKKENLVVPPKLATRHSHKSQKHTGGENKSFVQGSLFGDKSNGASS